MTTRTKSERRDIAAEITSKLVAELEKGVAPWACPWDRGGAPCSLPTNAKSGKPYRGVNVLLLWTAAYAAGYSDARWVTFNQARDLGGSVRKGERGTSIVFWQIVDREKTTGAASGPANEEPERSRAAFARYYTVFNVQQCDGLELDDAPAKVAEPGETERVAERVGATVEWHGVRAFYAPAFDKIVMPARERFESAEAREATLAHELVHFTGHASRLGREFGRRFGDDAYAFEELVAELGSAFLCAELGIAGELRHAEYLASWAKVLRADRYAIFSAARHAQEAALFLLPAKQLADEGEPV